MEQKTFVIPSLAGFVPREKFLVNHKHKKILYGNKFTELVNLSGSEFVEGTVFSYIELEESMSDEKIIGLCGIKAKTIGSIYLMMESHGSVLSDGEANVLYITHADTKLSYSVFFQWRGKHWELGADRVPGTVDWPRGTRVFF